VLGIHIPHDILDRIPNEKAIEKKVVPVGVYNKTLYMSVADPATFTEQRHFSFLTKLNIKPVFSLIRKIDTLINTKWAGASSDFWTG
jgi:hypothetical protein